MAQKIVPYYKVKGVVFFDVDEVITAIKAYKRQAKVRAKKGVRRPIPGVFLSAATVYRSIEKWHPTVAG